MKRRTFIKNSGWLAGGITLSNSFRSFGIMNDQKKINIGIIGCGDRGKGIMSVMKDLKNIFNVVAICDVLDFRFTEAKKNNAWQQPQILYRLPPDAR